MQALTQTYLSQAEIWMLITTLAYFLMNGAQLFETAVTIPKWTAGPPASLAALQGPYAPDLKTFWVVTHSIHEISFIIAIIFSWQILQTRYALLLIFSIHFLIRIWTIVYFAPKIMAFQRSNLEAPPSPELIPAVRRWRRLNYLRVAGFLLLSIAVAIVYGNMKNLQTASNTNIKHLLMEQRLTVITLGVDDLARQKEFYKTRIGWEPVAENKDIIFFKLNGLLFSLLDRKALAEGSGVGAAGNGFRSFTLSYNVPKKDEVDELYEQLKAKGIAIIKQPSPTPFGGYYFTFSDPEHNVLEVAYNPYIPMDEAGNVITHKNIDNL